MDTTEGENGPAESLEVRCCRCDRAIILTDFLRCPGGSQGGDSGSFFSLTAGMVPRGAADEPCTQEEDEGPAPPSLCTTCVGKALAVIQEDEKALRTSNEWLDHILQKVSAPGARSAKDMEMSRDQVLRSEKQRLLDEFRELKAESLELQNERIQIQNDLERLARAEASLIAEALQYRAAAIEAAEESARVSALTDYATRHLERLGRMNVINDTFHIWQDGKIATINGFRLGRLVHMNVSWDEINMALGQVCYLLNVLTRKHDIELKSYALLPKGSASAVLKKSDNSVFELRGSDGGLSRLFNGRRFDLALVGLLACLQEVIAQIDASPPYAIQNESIEGLSVRLQISGDEKWTKAMKFFLLNMKWVLAELESNPTSQYHHLQPGTAKL